MRFNFLKGSTLDQKDFILDKQEAYIDDFLYSNSVTLIYSPPKQGKTWLGYGITTTLIKREDIKGVIYVDMDNGLSSLKERSIDEKFINNPKIEYVSRAKIDCTPIEYLRRIVSEATVGNYKGYTFFLETTKDFVDFALAAGYDYVRLAPIIEFNPKNIQPDEGLRHSNATEKDHDRNWHAEGKGIITSLGDFEKYQWPRLEEVSYQRFEEIQQHLPDELKIVAQYGDIFTWVLHFLGFETFSFALIENPELIMMEI